MAGRKRTFDKQVALDKAMRLFWRNGYAGTSIANLTAELGINTPSLYAAFGNKEKLFKEALAHYELQYVQPHYQHLIETSDTSLKEQLQACYYGLITLFSEGDTPLGCLLVKSVNELDSVAFPKEVALYLKASGTETRQMLINLLAAKREQIVMREQVTIETLVDYLSSVSMGLAVQARLGQSEKVLKAIMDHAFNTFLNGD